MKTYLLTFASLTLFFCGYSQVRTSTGISSNTTSIQNGGSTSSHNSSYSSQSNNSANRYSDRNVDNNSNSNSNFEINSNSSSNNSNTWNNSNSNNSNTWSNSNNNYYNSNYNNSNNGYYNNTNYGTYSSNKGYVTTNDNYGENIVSESPSNAPDKFNTLNRAPLYNSNSAINRFFNQHQKPSQTFIINPNVANTLKANDGTLIKIKANSFIDKNGNVVTGDVEFEVKEVYGKGDMITSNAHTISNDMILESGGELYMDANRNGDPLMLANNKPIQVEMPTNGNGDMQLFYGRPDGNSVNWTLANNNSVAPSSNSNVATGNSYNFDLNGLGWMNCDKFRRNRGANTKISIRVPKQFDSTNTAVFIVFKGQNSVTRFDYYNGLTSIDQGQFSTRWYSVPVGAEVTLVAISEINGEYYSATKPVTIKADMIEDLNFNPTTMEIFKEDMAKLP